MQEHIENKENSFDQKLNQLLNEFPEFSEEESEESEENLLGDYRERVNLRIMPQCMPNIKPHTVVTEGDLHSHTMKIIYTLVKFGIITNMMTEWYEQLYKIYDKPIKEYSKKDLQDFEEILSRLEFNPQLYYRSLADDVADRGKLDELTWLLYKTMAKNKVAFTIKTANHTQEIISVSEWQAGTYEAVKFESQDIESGYVDSMENLEVIIENGLLTREEVFDHINQFYKPFLEAISYHIDGNKITIHTHAPFGLQDIKNLGELLGVKLEFSDRDLTKLGQYIDQINIKFQERIRKNTIWELCEARNADFNGDLTNFPYLKLIWNRYYAENLDRPIERNGNFFEWVHGHDMDGPFARNVIVLDSFLGKDKGMDEGEYHVFISIEPNFAKTHQFTLNDIPKIKPILSNKFFEKDAPIDLFSMNHNVKEKYDVSDFNELINLCHFKTAKVKTLFNFTNVTKIPMDDNVQNEESLGTEKNL